MTLRHAPAGLPPFRRPPSLGGTGKDPVFCIGSNCLPGGLQYRPDRESTKHGFIEPSKPMTLHEYEELLKKTGPLWKRVKGRYP